MGTVAEPVVAGCPGGKCDWPTTPSVAICGACLRTTFQTSCNATHCDYQMPSGSTANLNNFANDLDEGVGFQVMKSTGAQYNKSDPHALYIANFDVIGVPADTYANTSWDVSTIIASECALCICVQAYDAEMLPYGLAGSTGYSEGATHSFSQVLDSMSSQDLNPTVNYTFAGLPREMRPRQEATYTVNAVSMLAFEPWSDYFFTGTIWLNLHSQIPSNDMVRAIQNATANLDGWIKNLAASMSNVVRTSNPSTDDMYNGTAYMSVIQVKWLWISLPAALVVSSLALLVITIVRTNKSSVHAWKGSPMALLFMNVDHDIKESALNQMDTYNGIQKSVGKTRVVLDNDHRGNWTFRTT